MNKRADECLFCKSRSCYEHVYSTNDYGKTYNEVACERHIKQLHKHSDETAPGVMKDFCSSTGKQSRNRI
jgi:hypothetical protein